jgi:hypothetical protein
MTEGWKSVRRKKCDPADLFFCYCGRSLAGVQFTQKKIRSIALWIGQIAVPVMAAGGWQHADTGQSREDTLLAGFSSWHSLN